jgi:hypothetical protein
LSLALDFSGVFDWAAKSVNAWEREDTQNEQGVSEGIEVDGSRRDVLAMIVTESDFRNRFMAEGEHMEGTVDIHIMPPDQFYTKEADGKQTYFTFEGYTFKVADKIPVNATHLSYRAVRFNDTGNDRY